MTKLKFDFPNLDQIVHQITDSKLSDVRLDNEATVGLTAPIDLGKAELKLELGGEAKASIQALRVKDKDVLGVFGAKPEQDKIGTITPPLSPDGRHGWLKYAVTGGVSAKPGFSVPYVKIGAEVQTSLTFADYHIHDLQENVRAAIGSDVKMPLRLPFETEHVKRLAIGEAVALEAHLGLSLSLELSYSDAYTAALGQAVAFLKNTSILDVEFSASVSLSGTIALKDRFTLIFSRPADGRLRVDFRKAENRRGDVKFAVEAKVEAAGLNEIVDKVTEQIAKSLGSTDIESLLAKPTLTPIEQAMFQQAASALGLPEASSPKDVWDGIRKKIEEAVTLRLKVGFEYEYSRIRENETFFTLEIADADLDKVHDPLLDANLDKALRIAGPAALRNFFQRETNIWKQAWGFSLSFGKWTLLSSKDLKELKEVVEYAEYRKDRDERERLPKRIVYLGARSYDDRFPRLGERFAVDFRCEMSDFHANPTADQFRYGLYLLIQKEGKLKGDALRTLVDSACIWKVAPEQTLEQTLAKVRDKIGSKKCEVRVELKIDDPQFRVLADRFVNRDAHRAALAFARALPDFDLSFRKDIAERERLYSELWAEYLRVKGVGWSAAHNYVARLVEQHLRKLGQEDAAYVESQGDFGTFQGVLTGQAATPSLSAPLSGAYDKWDDFCEGMKSISEAIKNRQAAEPVIKKAFRDQLTDMWSQLFYVRALGALAVLLSTQRELTAIQRTLTVTVDGNEVLVLSSAGS